MLNRNAPDGAETAVDSPNKFVHLRGESLVLRNVAASRHGDLDENHLIRPIRILTQKFLKRQQLVRDTLDHVETVDTEHDFATSEAFAELVNVHLHLIRA